MKSTEVTRIILFLLCIAMLFTESSTWWGRRRRRRSRPVPPPCTRQNCAVSSWSSWDSCSYLCGNSGVQSRSRTIVTNPSCNGQPCPSLSESKACNRGNCLNQGTPHSTGCHCRAGYTGTCCGNGKLDSK